MSTLAQHGAQPAMHLALKRLKRDSLAVNANVAGGGPLCGSAARDNAIGGDFAIVDVVEVEESMVGDGEEGLDGGVAGDVAADADKVKAAVGGEGGGEEVCVAGDVGHVSGVEVAKIVVGDEVPGGG